MLKIFVSIIIILIGGAKLNLSVVENKIIKIPSYFTAFVFFILCFPLLFFTDSWQILTLLLLLIYGYHEIIKMNDLHIKKIRFFNIGFIFGIISVLNIHGFIFYPCILISLIYYGQFNWKNCIAILMGLVYPVIIYYTLKYLEFKHINYLYQSIQYNQLSDILYQYSGFLCVNIILMIFSFYELAINYQKKKEVGKRALNILFFIIITITVYAIISQYFELFFILIIPNAIIIANYLLYTKFKLVRTFLLGLLIILLMINSFYL